VTVARTWGDSSWLFGADDFDADADELGDTVSGVWLSDALGDWVCTRTFDGADDDDEQGDEQW